MDCETVLLKVSIPKERMEMLELYVKRTNGSMGNEVSRLLNKAINATYAEYPNLLEKEV